MLKIKIYLYRTDIGTCPPATFPARRVLSSLSGRDFEEASMSKDTWTKIRRLLNL